jgi:hypothetical protein
MLVPGRALLGAARHVRFWQTRRCDPAAPLCCRCTAARVLAHDDRADVVDALFADIRTWRHYSSRMFERSIDTTSGSRLTLASA